MTKQKKSRLKNGTLQPCLADATTKTHEQEDVLKRQVRQLQSRIAAVSRQRNSHLNELTETAEDLRRAKSDLEEQLEQSRKFEMLGRMIGDVSHDFNNLLTVMMGHGSAIMAATWGDHPVHNHAKEIVNVSLRAAQLSRKLLTFQGPSEPAHMVINVNKTIHSLQPMLECLLGDHIQLVLLLEDELPNIDADPVQVEQLILNLLVNARDAMPDGGMVTIRTCPDGGMDTDPTGKQKDTSTRMLLEVTDTGTGIPPEVRDEIFKPFFTTKRKDNGIGLGLSIVKEICEANDGLITVNSAVNAGTTFSISLPGSDTKEQPAVAEPTAQSHNRGNETILLVEDEEPLRVLCKHALERLGYNVIDACHGGDALLLSDMCVEPIHMIVTDVMMPQLNGVDLAEKLKILRPDIHVLFISGYAAGHLSAFSKDDPPGPLLQKPFSPDALTNKVYQILN